MFLTLPGTLHTSEQFFKSSAKQTEPDCPPKKNRLLVLSAVFGAELFKMSEQKTIWFTAPSRVYWHTGVIPLCVRQTAQVPLISPVTMREPSVENVMFVMLD